MKTFLFTAKVRIRHIHCDIWELTATQQLKLEHLGSNVLLWDISVYSHGKEEYLIHYSLDFFFCVQE